MCCVESLCFVQSNGLPQFIQFQAAGGYRAHEAQRMAAFSDEQLIPADVSGFRFREMRLLRETFSAWVSRTFDPEDDLASDDDSVPRISIGWFTIRRG